MTVRCKPGSISPTGGVMDYRGIWIQTGYAWVPERLGLSVDNTGRISRRGYMLWNLGWRNVGVADLPNIPPTQGVFCIHRERK